MLSTALTAHAAHAATVSGPCTTPAFTVGHITISNCQTSITYTIPNEGSFTPLDLTPAGVMGTAVDIFEPGGVTLGSGPVAQSYQGTITATFAMESGWLLSGGSIRFFAGDDGPAAGEDVTLSAPCMAINSAGGSCRPQPTPPGLSSGTINLQLFARSDAVCALCEHDSGHIDHGDLLFTEVQVPEPGTVGLISLGIALVFRRIKGVHSLTGQPPTRRTAD